MYCCVTTVSLEFVYSYFKINCSSHKNRSTHSTRVCNVLLLLLMFSVCIVVQLLICQGKFPTLFQFPCFFGDLSVSLSVSGTCFVPVRGTRRWFWTINNYNVKFVTLSLVTETFTLKNGVKSCIFIIIDNWALKQGVVSQSHSHEGGDWSKVFTRVLIRFVLLMRSYGDCWIMLKWLNLKRIRLQTFWGWICEIKKDL